MRQISIQMHKVTVDLRPCRYMLNISFNEAAGSWPRWLIHLWVLVTHGHICLTFKKSDIRFSNVVLSSRIADDTNSFKNRLAL